MTNDTRLFSAASSLFKCAGPTMTGITRRPTRLTDAQVLGEIEAVIRAMPPREKLHWDSPDVLEWLGRAAAAMRSWDSIRSSAFEAAVTALGMTNLIEGGSRKIVVMLHQAQNELRMEIVGPVNIAVDQGQVFQYFDQLRQVVEQASSDILFVDPYMESDFVARYLPHVKAGVLIRLLGRERMPALVSSARMFEKQHGAKIEIRSAKALHDRYVFIDGARCFQSGASFKDGAKSSGTTLTENLDAFAALRATYEGLWQAATVHP